MWAFPRRRAGSPSVTRPDKLRTWHTYRCSVLTSGPTLSAPWQVWWQAWVCPSQQWVTLQEEENTVASMSDSWNSLSLHPFPILHGTHSWLLQTPVWGPSRTLDSPVFPRSLWPRSTCLREPEAWSKETRHHAQSQTHIIGAWHQLHGHGQLAGKLIFSDYKLVLEFHLLNNLQLLMNA